MPDKALLRLHRVTDLFVSGREVLIDDTQAEPVLVWVAKLNAFQRGDAQRDAQAAQARKLVALHEDSDEIRAVTTNLESQPRDSITDFVLQPDLVEARMGARDDVLAEPYWFEKRPLLERAVGLSEDGNPPTEEEAAALAKLEEEFTTAVQEATDKRVAELRADLDQLDLPELKRRYVETWRNNVASNAMYDEYGRAEIFYTLRDCNGTRNPGNAEAPFDHKGCTHQRLLPNRAAVNELPEELITRVRRAIEQLNMAPADAGFSAAPESSSATSEQPSSAEASEPSTQEETPSPPAGT